MILPGHIALAIFGHKLLRVDLPTTLAATLAPDVIDKPLAHVLRVAPSGRYATHSLAGWVGASALVCLLGGQERGRAWAVGHFLHFVGDGGAMPWWLFFREYAFAPSGELKDIVWKTLVTSEGRRGLAFEMLLLGAALLWLVRDRPVKAAPGGK